MALADLYRQKLDLFQKLVELTDAMLEYTADQLYSDNPAAEQFTKLLAKRTSLINQIDGLDTKIEGTASENGQELLTSLRYELGVKMRKLQCQNERLEQVVKNSLEQLREQGQKLQEGKQSNRAYIGRRLSTEGSFIDKRR